jgi:hypothetical protein
MQLPKAIDLLFVAADVLVEAEIVELSDSLIITQMGEAWWNDAGMLEEQAANEIDRLWNWSELQIECGGRVLASRKLAVVTGDGAVQGAAMLSLEPVMSVLEEGEEALFVELLFTAPRNRSWIRRDATEQFRGVGFELLYAMCETSLDAGLGGRLKLESSPGFVGWYQKRGLLMTSEDPILYEGVTYTPMELVTPAATKLLAER